MNAAALRFVYGVAPPEVAGPSELQRMLRVRVLVGDFARLDGFLVHTR